MINMLSALMEKVNMKEYMGNASREKKLYERIERMC